MRKCYEENHREEKCIYSMVHMIEYYVCESRPMPSKPRCSKDNCTQISRPHLCYWVGISEDGAWMHLCVESSLCHSHWQTYVPASGPAQVK